MIKHLSAKQHVFLFAFATILFVSSSALGSVTITVRNDDPTGVGFSDNSPRSPVGGNTGTTLGQQRLNAAQHAANIWGALLTSNTEIVIGATWSNLMPCEIDGATLASAGSHGGIRNSPNVIPNTWYPLALANAIAGSDRNGTTVEIDAEFNLRIGQANCLPTRQWYLGLDNAHGSTGVDLVTVALHEFGHGLGFASFTNETNGVEPSGFPTIFDTFLFDNTTSKFWPQMTDAERQASAINFRNLVWAGPQVTAGVPSVLSSGFDASNRARVFTPNPVDPGSSVSHFDTSLTPNQLMEPNISNNLTHSVSVPQDLTLALMIDIGWNAGPPPSPTPTPPPPPNDNFAFAQVITGCSGSVTGTNAGSTHEPGEPEHLLNGEGGTHSVWYQWQSPFNGSVTFDTIGSNYDTALAIYTGSPVNNLVNIGRNDDIEPIVIQTSRLSFNASAGTLYKIAVDGFNGGDGGDTGPIKLNLSTTGCTAPGAAPQILLEDPGPVADQAAIFDSVLHIRDPLLVFNSTNFFNPVGDPNARAVIFVANLQDASPPPPMVVNLVDSSNKSFDITPESVNGFTEFPFDQITFRLPSGLASGTVKVRVFSQSLISNTATFRIL